MTPTLYLKLEARWKYLYSFPKKNTHSSCLKSLKTWKVLTIKAFLPHTGGFFSKGFRVFRIAVDRFKYIIL